MLAAPLCSLLLVSHPRFIYDSADITMGIGASGYVRVRVRNVRVARAVLAIASGRQGAKVLQGVAVFVRIDRFCATRWRAAACQAVAATATSVMAAVRAARPGGRRTLTRRETRVRNGPAAKQHSVTGCGNQSQSGKQWGQLLVRIETMSRWSMFF